MQVCVCVKIFPLTARSTLLELGALKKQHRRKPHYPSVQTHTKPRQHSINSVSHTCTLHNKQSDTSAHTNSKHYQIPTQNHTLVCIVIGCYGLLDSQARNYTRVSTVTKHTHIYMHTKNRSQYENLQCRNSH